MTILVTGGAGYIGAQMSHALVDSGLIPIVLDDLSTGARENVPQTAIFVEGDIGDAALLSTLMQRHRIRAVMHFAAKTVVSESATRPLEHYLTNTCKTRTLIEAAVDAGVPHFIFSSTASVYGEPVRAPIPDDDVCLPISPYGWSKLMAEQILADAAAAHDLRFVTLRYFNVAGADPDGRTGQSTPNVTHLIKAAVQTALGVRPHLDVYGDDYPTPDGTCLRDYIHVADLAAAHLSALCYLEQGGASLTCNCGYGRGTSVREVIDVVKRVSGVNFEVRQAPRRPGDPAILVGATDRARAHLNWRPERADLALIVADALAWERKLMAR